MADPIRALRRIHLEPVDRIPHWEHLSNPDFVQHVTGIDPYEHPRAAAQAAYDRLPLDMGFGVPASDEPIPRPADGESSATDAEGHRMVRWGDGHTWHWDWGRDFPTIEDILAYDPLADMDQRGRPVVAECDYRLSVEELARQFNGGVDPTPGGPRAGTLRCGGYYNTLFMWPLLTFGWEGFLELAGGYPEDCRRLLAGFAERSRRYCRAWSLTDIDAFVAHDDICCASGPVCSPTWLREFVYPYYEEFFGYFRDAGIPVLFMTDGNADLVVDDVFAAGAHGLVSEPATNWAALAERYPGKVLVGEGDNRILMRNRPEEIEAHVREMCERGRHHAGYFLCVGNHIPWNVPPEAVELYFACSERFGGLGSGS